jgi:pimeloyl-ACP methyl ester carboxylesterase
MADDVFRLLDHAGVAAAHVIGHSMGGRIALRLAASRPDRVRSAVLIASGGTLASAAGSDPMPVERVAASLETGGGFGPLLEAVLPRDRPLPRWRLRLLDFAASATNDGRALASAARGYAGLAVTDAELAGLRVPIAAVVGSEDPYRTAVDALARRLPGMPVVVVEGATHLDVLGRPETRLALNARLSAGTGLRRAA